MVASVTVVENVTTVFGTPEPAAFLTVALTLAGLPGLMLDTAMPVLESVKATVSPGTPTLEALTLKAALPETGEPPTVAVAVMLAAPAASGPVGSI